MKKGFTLVELLAVIIVLGLIVLITIPIVRNIIDTQKFNQFKLSVEGLIKAVNDDIATDDYELPRRYEYKSIGMNSPKDLYLVDGEDYIPLQVTGSIKYNATGKIIVTAENKIIVYVVNNKFCAVKEATDNDVYYGIYSEVENEGNICITSDEVDLSNIINALKNE